jgi:hypothetical protein
MAQTPPDFAARSRAQILQAPANRARKADWAALGSKLT